jgi:hypothetical protein
MCAAFPRSESYGHADSTPGHRRIWNVLPRQYFRAPWPSLSGLPCSHGWTLQDRVGGGYPPTYACDRRFLSGHGVNQVHPCHPVGSKRMMCCRGVGRQGVLYVPPLTVPSGNVLRQGCRAPTVEIRFV